MDGTVRPTPAIDPSAHDHIVVFFANALGDHLMALPTLRALSASLDGRFTLATAVTPTDLLFGGLRCQRAVEIPIRWNDGFFEAGPASNLLGPVDLFISLNYWHNPSLTALLQRLTPALTLGFNPRFGHPIVADTSRHHIDQVFQVCELLGVSETAEAHAYPFPLPAESVEFATRLRAALATFRLLVVHVETKPAKSWPVEDANRAIEAFLDAHPDYVAVALAKREERLAGLSPRVIPLVGLPLASAAAVVAAADLFLGVDSFPLHVADLWRVPGVGLYGPTSSAMWGYRFTPGARHVDGRGTMAAIDPREVAAGLGAVAREGFAPRPDLMGNASAPVVTLRYC